jgi:hypothetical protein
MIRGHVAITMMGFGICQFRVVAGGPWEALFHFLGKYPLFHPNEVRVEPAYRHPTGLAEFYLTIDKRGA